MSEPNYCFTCKHADPTAGLRCRAAFKLPGGSTAAGVWAKRYTAAILGSVAVEADAPDCPTWTKIPDGACVACLGAGVVFKGPDHGLPTKPCKECGRGQGT